MARMARAVAAGYPHHITQRGNRRQQTFFSHEDYKAYKDLLKEWCDKNGVEIWAYCLMPNHIHLIAVPGSEDGLMKAVSETHRRYSRLVNFREGWRGHLWQGRFASFIMDEKYLFAAVRYIEMNPVRARLVEKPEDWQWSSVSMHITGYDDGLTTEAPLFEKKGDWGKFLASAVSVKTVEKMRLHEGTGRPLGSARFVSELEHVLNRSLRPGKPGPKPRAKGK